jgi:hypothetical protein
VADEFSLFPIYRRKLCPEKIKKPQEDKAYFLAKTEKMRKKNPLKQNKGMGQHQLPFFIMQKTVLH